MYGDRWSDEALLGLSIVVPSYGRPDALIRLATSVVRSNPIPSSGLEVIIVSAGYDDTLLRSLRRLFESSPILLTIIELRSAEPTSVSRNIGAWMSQGEYLFFVDDDNELSEGCAYNIWQAITQWSDCCVVAPVMYWGEYPEAIWCAGITRTRFILHTKWRREIPAPTPERIQSVDFPNAFAVRSHDFLVVGGFDGRVFPQMYEEADLIARIKDVTGQGAYCVTAAATRHYIGSEIYRQMHMTSEASAYRLALNRKSFICRHGTILQIAIDLIVGRWLFLIGYLYSVRKLPSKEKRLIRRAYLRGILSRVKR